MSRKPMLLMTDAGHFEVSYVINPWMKPSAWSEDREGHFRAAQEASAALTKALQHRDAGVRARHLVEHVVGGDQDGVGLAVRGSLGDQEAGADRPCAVAERLLKLHGRLHQLHGQVDDHDMVPGSSGCPSRLCAISMSRY